MIPKTIHQIWIQGFDKAPVRLQKYSIHCENVNNNFEHIIWDDNSIRELLINKFGQKYLKTYDSYTIFAQKADFARYAILYTYGGIYLDMDMICRKNLEPFLSNTLFFTTDSFYIFSKRYLNGIIGVVPNHPVFKIIFEKAFERKYQSNNVTYSTGTKLFYDSVLEYSDRTKDTNYKIVDRKYLHPCQLYDSDDCPITCRDCFIAHTNEGSWNTSIMNFINKVLLKNIKLLVFLLVIIVAILILIILEINNR